MSGPAWLSWLADRLLPLAGREFILGDLLELHHRRQEEKGAAYATYCALRDLVGSAVNARRAPEPPMRPKRRESLWSGLHDLRAASRMFAREPGFVLVTVLTLSLGAGAAIAVFSMANTLALRPVPGVIDPHRGGYLTLLDADGVSSTSGFVDPKGLATLDFDRLREEATLLEHVGSFGNSPVNVSVGGERPRSVSAGSVYGAFFEALGTRPLEGRVLTAADVGFDADPLVVVIAAELRDELFGPGGAAVGRTLIANGVPVEVVGVTPYGFRGALRRSTHQLWYPYPALVELIGFGRERLLDRYSTMHDELVVRPRPDATPDAIEAQVAGVLNGIANEYELDRDYLRGLTPRLFMGFTTGPGWRGRAVKLLSLLAGAVMLVLIVTCANAANLMLFRNARWRGRTAVRRALGASTGRIARTRLFECLILALAACGSGVLVAHGVYRAFRTHDILRVPVFETFVFDGRIVAFALALSGGTTLLFGLLPALWAGRFSLAPALKASGGKETRSRARLRWWMAAGQIALSLTLLIGGVLLTRSTHNLFSVDTGMRVAEVGEVYVEFPGDQHTEASEALGHHMLESLRALPGVSGAAAALYGPHGPGMYGRAGLPGQDPVEAEFQTVTAGYFELLGVKDWKGDPIVVEPEEWRTGVALLSESLATRLFGDADRAIGQKLSTRMLGEEDVQIVGVTGALRRPSRPDVDRDAIFIPWDGPIFSHASLLYRGRPLTDQLVSEASAVAAEALPLMPIPTTGAASDDMDAYHAESRLLGRLVAMLSGLATGMAAIGLYGVTSFAIAGRQRELGIRVAMGAGRTSIVGLVSRFCGSIVVVGVVSGLLGGALFSMVLRSRLFGIAPFDASAYLGTCLAFAVVAVLACWAPTRRALAVDPVRVLGAE
ncbi:MAG: ABC transporter permease [Gemmatimonadota bacterium]